MVVILFPVPFKHDLFGLKATERLQIERQMQAHDNISNIFTNRNYIYSSQYLL